MLNLCNKNNTAMENLQIINAKIASVLGKVCKYLYPENVVETVECRQTLFRSNASFEV